MSLIRWNVRRKWKQSVNFDSMASDAELDEAYLDELERQVRETWEESGMRGRVKCASR